LKGWGLWVFAIGLKGFVVQKVTLFLDSLPMMFGSKLKSREVIRCLDDVFRGYSVGIRRLDKKIASHQKVNFSQKTKNFQHPIF
jgi:hypothetical protein